MADGNTATTMRRKLEAGRPRADANAVTPVRALGQAFSHAAEQALRLAMRALEGTESRRSLEDLPDALEDLALLLILSGSGGAAGLMAISPAVLSGLIERHTTGRIGTAALAPRKPTQTDAAVVAAFIDKVLLRFGAALGALPAGEWAAGYGYKSYAEDARPLALLLDDIPYRVLSLTVEMVEGGRREGSVLLALPEATRRPGGTGPGSAGSAKAMSAPGYPAGWTEQLESAVMGAEADVRAVLARLMLPIAEVMELSPGRELPLPADALDRVPLETLDGRTVARGRLGQSRGFRAIRIVPADARVGPGGPAATILAAAGTDLSREPAAPGFPGMASLPMAGTGMLEADALPDVG